MYTMPKKLRYFNDNDPWMLAEDIPDMDAFFAQIWQSGFTDEFRYPSGVTNKKVLSIHRGYHLWFSFGKEDSYRVGEVIAKKIIHKVGFAKKVNEQIILWSDRLRAYARTIPEQQLFDLTNRDLWDWYLRHDRIHTAYYRWGWIPVAADMFHNNLTERLKQYLRLHTEESKINEYLVVLTQPRKKSPIQIEQEDFLKIARVVYLDVKQRKLFSELFRWFKVKEAAKHGLNTHTPEYERLLEERVQRIKDRISPRILRLVEKHYRNYFYLKYMWIGKEGVYTFDYYLKELVRLIGNGINPSTVLSKSEREFRKQAAKRNALLKTLGIKNPWRDVLDAWGDFMVTKIYRRFAQLYAIYRMQPILQEIARRLKLSLKEVRFMLKDEVREALLKGKIRRKELRQRTKLAVFYYEYGVEKVFVGKRARRLAAHAEKSFDHDTDEIRGQVGCIGKATGTVKVIIRPQDMAKMRPGDILVSIATDPDIVPAMKKAAAIITEQGGVTSHAAIVARELNIPCVIGTKIATRVLKDGDQVEVDAHTGIVKKL